MSDNKQSLPEMTVESMLRPENKIISTKTILRITAVILGSLLTLLLVYKLREPLVWTVIAAILAISLSGPVNLLARRMPRTLAITLVYLVLVLIPIGVGFLIAPPLIDQISSFINSLPNYLGQLSDQLSKSGQLGKINQNINLTGVIDQLANNVPSSASSAASALGGAGLAFAHGLLGLLIIIVMSIFMVANGHAWLHTGLGWLSEIKHRERIERACEHIASAVSGYVAGAFFQAALAGITTYIVLTILGIPMAGALAVLVAIADLVPIIGAAIAAVFIAVITLWHGWPVTTIVWIIWSVVYQQFENAVIQPQIQKRAVAMHPFMVLISVLFGAALFGIIGALIAIPLAASFKIAFLEWASYRAEINFPEEANDSQTILPSQSD